jgi:preprotein translocase subunit YajC
MNPIEPFVPTLSTVALQAAGGGFSGLASILQIVLIFVVFYLLLFMPMRKKQKALQQVIESLKKGDKVVTNGGLYGEVVAVSGPTVILKIADNVKVRIAKSAISGLEPGAETTGSNT